MVHRSSTSSMKTSASPQSTACSTAPPSVPLPGGADQDLTQTTAKLLTADLTCSSDSSAAAVTATNPPIKNATKELSDNSTGVLRSKQMLTPVWGEANNRTSGRKRTPKTCDCCGPNRAGHNVKASGRGRGRGTDKDLGATAKRKVKQSVNIKVNEEEEEEKVQSPVAVSESPSQIHVATASAPASTDIAQNGPLRNSDATEERSVQKTEDVVKACTGHAAGQGNGNGRDAHTNLLGTACRGTLVVTGREGGIVKALIASNIKDDVEIKSGNIINVTTGALAQSALEGSQNSQISHAGQNKPSSVGSPLGNGETVSLTDTDEEMEDSVVSEAANGLVSSSARLGVSSSQDSEMQVDQISDQTDQVFLSLMSSNGKVTTPTECDQKSFPMEVETCHPATHDSPSRHGSYCSQQQRALLGIERPQTVLPVWHLGKKWDGRNSGSKQGRRQKAGCRDAEEGTLGETYRCNPRIPGGLLYQIWQLHSSQ
ncbi:hypothetical protein OJAV_G00032250 [Oryzias javanicus]|uniref:Uncharacterized protein n=1 Tax=Oryzias javanicus TaxID=123683 RepID=A0A3S2PH37_ORYJA|nr:hypothetical protein OJAV_G00032250 [Oryzias javanicus]